MIPAILGGGALLAGHKIKKSAREKNEKAQELMTEAQSMYNVAKNSFERTQKNTEKALESLGKKKQVILDTSISDFLLVYDRIKDIKLKESTGLNEVSNLVIDDHGVLELRELSSLYSAKSIAGSTAAGVATGAAVALAASGYLSVVGGALQIAGTAATLGEFGLAASAASSALSIGAAGISVTPLGLIAAPVVVFAALSSNKKAQENLENAEAAFYEAESAVENMKNTQVMLNAVAKRSKMLEDLLEQLNPLFVQCTKLLDKVTEKKSRIIGDRAIAADDLTQEEMNLAAVTRSLAGAVKAIIDVPILSSDGSMNSKAETVYNNVSGNIPKPELFMTVQKGTEIDWNRIENWRVKDGVRNPHEFSTKRAQKPLAFPKRLFSCQGAGVCYSSNG